MKYIIAASKIYIELVLPCQIWDCIRDPEQILVWKRPSASSKSNFFGAFANRQYVQYISFLDTKFSIYT